MLLSLLGICALVALLELDTTYVGQFLISRPLFVGSILGLITGNLFLGVQIGLFTELIYIDFLPIGGIVPPSGAITSAMALMMKYSFNMDIYFAFFVGILTGILFSFVEKKVRQSRGKILPVVCKNLVDGKTTASSEMLKSLGFEFMVIFTFLIMAIALFGPLFNVIDDDIPEKLHSAFKFSYYAVPWIGICSLFSSFSTKPKVD